jgi:hypothetical protein
VTAKYASAMAKVIRIAFMAVLLYEYVRGMSFLFRCCNMRREKRRKYFRFRLAAQSYPSAPAVHRDAGMVPG